MTPALITLLNGEDFDLVKVKFPTLAPAADTFDAYLDDLDDQLDLIEQEGKPYPRIFTFSMNQYLAWCEQHQLNPSKLNIKTRFMREHDELALQYDGDLGVHVELLDWIDSMHLAAMYRLEQLDTTASSAGAIDLFLQQWIDQARLFQDDIVEQLETGEHEITVSISEAISHGSDQDDVIVLSEHVSCTDSELDWASEARRDLINVGMAIAMGCEGIIEILSAIEDEDGDYVVHRVFACEGLGKISWRELTADEIASGELFSSVLMNPATHIKERHERDD